MQWIVARVRWSYSLQRLIVVMNKSVLTNVVPAYSDYTLLLFAVCKEPPYKVEESGYAGFLMPIEVYFKNKVGVFSHFFSLFTSSFLSVYLIYSSYSYSFTSLAVFLHLCTVMRALIHSLFEASSLRSLNS